MWELARWLKERPQRSRVRTLFDSDAKDLSLPMLPPQDERARLRREYATLGFLCDRHPMTLFADAVKRSTRICVWGRMRISSAPAISTGIKRR